MKHHKNISALYKLQKPYLLRSGSLCTCLFGCLFFVVTFYYILFWHVTPHQVQSISNFRNFGRCLIFESQNLPKYLLVFNEDLKSLEPQQKFVLRFGYVSQMSYFVPLPYRFGLQFFLENKSFLIKLKVLRAVTVNNTVFWNVLLCSRRQSKRKSIRELLGRYNVHCDFYW